jgi:hypothetical protein
MNQNDPTCKPFERTKFEARQFPPLLAELLGRHMLLPEMTAEDLREMSKFDEIPNVEGLAAHKVEYPLARDPGEPPTTPHFAKEVTPAILKALDRGLKPVHTLVVRGALGGASQAPFSVQIIVPQFGAQLAMALKQMLWPLEKPAGPVAHTLFLWPRPLKDKFGRVLAENWVHQRSGTGFGMTIGNDDLYMVEALLRAAAAEFWETRPGMRRIASGEGVATVDREAGTAKFVSAEDETDTPFFSEDLLIEEGGWISPVWANPKVPVCGLAGDEALRRAALGLGSIMLGVASDGEGHFPLLHQAHDAGDLEKYQEKGLDIGGYVIVQRGQLPPPWMNEARKWKLEG